MDELIWRWLGWSHLCLRAYIYLNENVFSQCNFEGIFTCNLFFLLLSVVGGIKKNHVWRSSGVCEIMKWEVQWPIGPWYYILLQFAVNYFILQSSHWDSDNRRFACFTHIRWRLVFATGTRINQHRRRKCMVVYIIIMNYNHCIIFVQSNFHLH